LRSRPPTPPSFPYTTLFRSVIQAIAGDPEGIALGEQHVPEGRHALILVEIGTIALHQDLPLLEAHLADQSLRAGGHILVELPALDRKSTRLNSSHVKISYAV